MRIVADESAVIQAGDARTPERADAMAYLHANHFVIAPALLSSECGNVVHRKAPGAFGRDANERAEALEALLDGVHLVAPDAGSRIRTAGLVGAHGLTFYDAEYLALAASEERGVLLTADAKLLAAAKKLLGKERAFSLDEATVACRDGRL